VSDSTRKVFGSAVGGYNRAEVDNYIAWLQKNLKDLEQYNSLAIKEQQSLRERLVQLEEQAKLAKSPGYAQLGAQFEQTLRLAESEAAKLINDASNEALRIREAAKAEAERTRFEVEDEVKSIRTKAEREAKALVSSARKQADSLVEEAEDVKAQITAERAQLEKEANVVRSDADNYVAKAKAELQADIERIQSENARLLKRNADIEAEIKDKIDIGEKQALDIFRRVQREAEELREQADRELKAATAEAASLIDNAETTLENARNEANRLASESEAMALNMIADARSRAESLAIKSLDITREAIAEAEYRLAKLPTQQNSIEDFLSETKSLLTPEQEIIISRRRNLESSLRKPIEPEVMQAEPQEDVTEVIAESEEKDS